MTTQLASSVACSVRDATRASDASETRPKCSVLPLVTSEGTFRPVSSTDSPNSTAAPTLTCGNPAIERPGTSLTRRGSKPSAWLSAGARAMSRNVQFGRMPRWSCDFPENHRHPPFCMIYWGLRREKLHRDARSPGKQRPAGRGDSEHRLYVKAPRQRQVLRSHLVGMRRTSEGPAQGENAEHDMGRQSGAMPDGTTKAFRARAGAREDPAGKSQHGHGRGAATTIPRDPLP